MAKKGYCGRIFVGTSGWMYKDWGEMFYPKDLKKGHLTYLSREFRTVEVNTSFYHLPLASTFTKWRGEVPADFVFAVKISRYITHRKKLSGVREPIDTFLKRAVRLKEKLGPILIQLPPFLKYDESLFDAFIDSLAIVRDRHDRNIRFAIEPRHGSWMEDGAASHVRVRLRKMRNSCLVFPHSARIASFEPNNENIVSDFTYVRFHGPSEWAASRYGPHRLRPWAERITRWCERGLDTYVYFNNDIHGHAVIDARTLKRQLNLPY